MWIPHRRHRALCSGAALLVAALVTSSSTRVAAAADGADALPPLAPEAEAGAATNAVPAPVAPLPSPEAGFTLPAEEPLGEEAGPDILIEPILRAEIGAGVVVSAEIVDPEGVFEPKLYFRAIGDTKYLSNAMVPSGGTDLFRGEIPSTAVTGPMEYYVEAFDKEGNGPSRSAPPARPHRVFVGPPEQAGGVDRAVKTGPAIVHVVVERAPKSRSIPIEASFRGTSGVFNAVVYFRRIGSASFTPLSMAELPLSAVESVPKDVILGTAGTGRYVAEIPTAFTTGDVEYYLEAMDAQGNGPSFHGSRDRPHVIATFVAREVRIDPDVALMACREIPREGESPDTTRLGPCRRVEEAVGFEAITRYGLGEVKLRYDNYPDAVAAFEEASRVAPKWPAAWFRLGQAAEGQRDWPKARDAYLAYLELAGRPPEFDALMKRVAQVEYELDLLQRDAKEAAASEAKERAREDEKRRQREQAEQAKEERATREMLLSAPGHWGYFGFSTESYVGVDRGFAQQAGSLELRGRFKWPGLPFLFGGLGLAVSALTPGAGGPADSVLTVLPAIGLNFLALPVPRTTGFTLLSPFVAYQPRIQATGPLASQGPSAAPIVHALVLGNHLEFGTWSVELTWGFGIAGSNLAQHLGIAVGRRLSEEE